MEKIFKIFLIAFLWSNAKAENTAVPNQFQALTSVNLPNRGPTTNKDESLPNPGPIVAIMEDMAYNTAQITDEMQVQLNSRVDRTSNALLGNIQVLITNSMDEISDAFFQANQLLMNDSCPQNWTMDDLLERVNTQLANCTTDLRTVMEEFRNDAELITETLQSYVKDIVALPKLCEILTSSADSTFASATSCFVQKMADYNKEVSQVLNNANTAVMQTRQVSRTNGITAKQCTNNVIQETIEFLDRSFEKCRRA